MIKITRITKEESIAIRGKFPSTPITITNRQSSHKSYYVEESFKIMRFLETLRQSESRGDVKNRGK